MEVDLVSEALTFMLLGMGIVFLFIILMIIAMNLQKAFVERCLPDAPSGPDATSGSAAPTASPASKNNNKIAAIIGAICKHQEAK
jgi:oxaloacetate decarboxylase gamma subunit